MKISTEIGSIAAIVGEERAVEYVARAGFDGWDYTMSKICDCDGTTVRQTTHPLGGEGYLAFVERVGHVARECGIVCNQTHAPHPVVHALSMPWMRRAIECTAAVGGSICVIHPDTRTDVAGNAAMYGELIPFAAARGVTIATENMWNWDEKRDEACFASCATPESFCAHVDAAPGLVACLDIGHAEMRGNNTNAVEMIRALGHRIHALHLHDNDKWHDVHDLPFTMDIDFVPIVRALAEVGYDGWFTLESYHYIDGCALDEVPAAVCRMADAARRLALMFENERERLA